MNQSISSAYPACPNGLDQDQIEAFGRDGFLAFSDVIGRAEVQSARAGLTALLQNLMQGEIERQGTVWRASGRDLLFQFEADYTPRGSTIAEAELQVRKFMSYADELPIFQSLSRTQPRIQGILEALLGAAPILYQSMALVKPPLIGSEKPWHQDDAYFAVTPLDAICGVWIALDEATASNGCMHVLRGAHRGGPLKHFASADNQLHGPECEILPDRLDAAQALAVELPAGGAMFFSGLLPHYTPFNRSPDRRRALQFHYRAANSQILERDVYDTLFAESDGTPASCHAAKPKAL